MQSNTGIHKASQIDQMQAQLFKKKLKEKLVKLEEEYKNATGYKRNSIYQKMRSLEEYVENEEYKIL